MWYVVTTDGEMILCDSEDEATNICAARGVVWTHGYAKHLGA